MSRTLKAGFFSLCLLPALAVAQADPPDMNRLSTALGGVAPDSIAETPVAGLYEVVLGSQILYLSQDGRFVVQGDLIDLDRGDNLTETRRADLRFAAIEAVGEDKMIIFPAGDETRHTITVFTDIDCGYCRQLHREIATYNEQGITVRYLAYPRAGIGSPSYDKAVNVWCADDPRTAITRAKRGEPVESRNCPNPVKEQYQLGQSLGVRGTPSIITDTGQLLPGYVPAARLAQVLEADPSR